MKGAGRSGSTTRTVAVIGAGASGLVAAKRMMESGFDVTIYESGGYLGGLWVYDNDSGTSAAYKSLHINTDKFITQFDDYPLPDTASTFPHHSEMRQYLDSYAEKFGLRERVLFNTPVVRVSPVTTESGTAWQVDDAKGGSTQFNMAIVASGHQSTPRHPDFAASFTGEYLHSHKYREPAPFLGKRVCVVGAGNSGCDIAADVCVTADRTVMAVRSGVTILPKIAFGIPVSRIYTTMARPWIPKAFVGYTVRLLSWALHGDLTKIGFQKPDRTVHASAHPTLIAHIFYRRIEVKPGIRRVEGRWIEFEDGTREEFDTLIAATGYLIDVPTIPAEVLSIGEGHVPLYKRVVPVDWRGLYFVGLLQFRGAFFRAFDAQARWIAAIESKKCSLPTREEMLSDIERKQRFNLGRYHGSPRHYLEEEAAPYLKELQVAITRGSDVSAKRTVSGWRRTVRHRAATPYRHDLIGIRHADESLLVKENGAVE